MTHLKITRDDDFGGAVLNCAVRYALGRQSYMPGLVMDEIRPMLPDCSERTLWCFDQDITEWLERSEPSLMNDYTQWQAFRDTVRAERETRRETET